MALTKITLAEIERVFEVLERLGISREAVVIPLRPESPGRMRVLPNGKAEIVNGELVRMPPTGGKPGLAGGKIFIAQTANGCS